MKKITLMSFLMLTAFLTAQTSLPIDFEDGTTTVGFQFEGVVTSANIANPDQGAGNMSDRVLQFNKPETAAWYGGFGYGSPSQTLVNLASGRVFTFKIWSTKANVNVRMRLQNSTNGAPAYQVDVPLATANAWVELSFDFTSQTNGTETYGEIVIQPNIEVSETIVGDGTYFIDDIVQVGAPAPTCNDGIQNGDEEGVDCGGSCPDSCDTVDEPTEGSGHNGSTGSEFYAYSGLSGNANESDFTGFTLFDFSGGGTVPSEETLNGDKVIRFGTLGFAGSNFGEEFNATGSYTFVHLSYYAINDTQWNFSLVDKSLADSGVCCGNPAEPFYQFGSGLDAPISTGEWVSVFIPLSHFNGLNNDWDGTDLVQTLFTSSGNTVYIDNIYFTTSDVLSTNEFNQAQFQIGPNPTSDRWMVNSQDVIESIQVFDLLGKQVISLEPNAVEAEIEAGSLKSGIYLARIKGLQGTKTIKLVKN